MLARFFGKPDRPVLPQLLNIAEYEKLMPTLEFFPRPEWEQIRDKIGKEHPDFQDQTWQDFAHIWLTRLSYRLEVLPTLRIDQRISICGSLLWSRRRQS